MSTATKTTKSKVTLDDKIVMNGTNGVKATDEPENIYTKRYKSVEGSCYKLNKKFAGCINSGLGDLSYNKKYRE